MENKFSEKEIKEMEYKEMAYNGMIRLSAIFLEEALCDLNPNYKNIPNFRQKISEKFSYYMKICELKCTEKNRHDLLDEIKFNCLLSQGGHKYE